MNNWILGRALSVLGFGMLLFVPVWITIIPPGTSEEYSVSTVIATFSGVLGTLIWYIGWRITWLPNHDKS